MASANVLVAEDDTNILEGLVDTLASEGYRVTAAQDGRIALERFERDKFDLVLLDVMMPGVDGYEVCREIRARSRRVAIIMLTAKGEEIDKVVGLQLGADDYITKPFGVHELLARIAAVLRRCRQRPRENNRAQQPAQAFNFGPALIDPLGYQAHTPAGTFDLSAREVRLLSLFYKHPGQVLSREYLLNAAWGIDYFGTTRTLDQHMAKLRKKIEPHPGRPRFIETVHGLGYRYRPAGAEGAKNGAA
jgi:DNA-binding response OmpR family regulator